MTVKTWIFTLGFFFLGLRLEASPVQDADLQRSVQDAFNQLLNYAFPGYSNQGNIRLQLVDGDLMATESLDKGLVVVNMTQLKFILANIGSQYQVYLVRLVVAHELAHQVQFVYYRGILPQVLSECQADILAGLYFDQLFFDEIMNHMLSNGTFYYPYLQGQVQLLATNTANCITAMKNLGDNYSKDNTHPRDQQRAFATREAFLYDEYWLRQKIAAMPGIPPQNTRQLADELNRYEQLLDLQPGESTVDWSYVQAQKLIHNQIASLKQIAVYSRWDWGNAQTNPFCTVYHKIRNIGTTPVKLYFSDRIYAVTRRDTLNPISWMLQSNDAHYLELNPGETAEVTGRMQWQETDKYRCKLIKLGDPLSLYSFYDKSENEGNIPQYIPGIEGLVHPPGVATVYDTYLSERDLFDTYIAGVGISHDPDFGQVSFPSKLRVPATDNTQLISAPPTSSCLLNVSIYHGIDQRIARSKVGETIAILKSVKQGLTYQKESGPSCFAYWILYDNQQNRLGKVTLEEHPNTRTYITTLDIEPLK